MGYLFDRVAEVTIGEPGQPGLVLAGLRMAFRVEKSLRRTCNTATLDIYNLSAAKRNEIAELGLQKVLMIKAGYAEDMGPRLIFYGDITYSAPHQTKRSRRDKQFFSRRQGADIVTRLEGAEGDKDLRETRVTFSYEPGAPAWWILKDLIAALRANGGRLSGPTEGYLVQVGNKVYNQGISFTGPAAEALDKVCAFAKLEWSVQQGRIQILRLGLHEEAGVIYLNSQTGLVGSPERLLDMAGALKSEAEAEIDREPNNVYVLKTRKSVSGWRAEALRQ